MAQDKSLLTPDELAALTEGVRNGSIDTGEGYNVQPKVRKHDLVSEDSSLGVNVASLDMINERFIRLFRLGMLEVLRASPRLNPARVQIIRFGDYLKTLRPPLSVNTLRMAPLRGQSIVIIEPSVIFASLDSFFGGFGRGVSQLAPGRLFTPTEARIIKLILEVFFRSMREAWLPISPVEFELVGSEINPQFAQIADEADLVVLSRFETENAEAGFIDMVIPYMSLKPVRDLLRSRVQTGDGNDASDKAWRVQLNQSVDEATLELQVLLGQLQLSLKELEGLAPGKLLYFKKDEHARAYICDTPVFDVEVGSAGTQVACRVVGAVSLETEESAGTPT